MKTRIAALSLLVAGAWAQAAEVFPLSDVRLQAGPFLDAQTTNLNYLMAMEPDRLLAPFLREAGLQPRQPSYGNWESTGLDGHMGGHYLSALALMHASTGDAETLRRLNYFVAELKRAQLANGDGYIGGIPGGRQAWRDVAAGKLEADNFSVNGKWVPWYNLHKVYAGLRDAWRYAGNEDAKVMLVALSDWALALTSKLSPEQMQTMLRSEHGGMNEIFVDVAEMTGDRKYLDLALAFSHQAILQPLAKRQDQLTGLHANTQIPKVIGFKRIHDATGRQDMGEAAKFFWQTVVDKRSVAIGGNSVKEHFHSQDDFDPMVHEVEGPETCNTYNMLKLTQMLFQSEQKGSYGDYYERALYNHILSSQRPEGGFVYFTPMRPNHYRVYSQVDHGMWCCVGSGIESHAKYGEFIYAHEKDTLFVNLFVASTLNWREKNVRITQATSFPDTDTTRLTVDGDGRFAMKIRYPLWVAPGRMEVKVNGKAVKLDAQPGNYATVERAWKKGDRVDVRLPMTTHLEQMPGKSNYYAVLHGPVVLAAKTRMLGDEKLNFLADDSRMGHIASGPMCPLESAPMFVSDSTDFLARFKPVAGKPLTFTAPGLVHGADGPRTEFIPFFRLHESRYTMYWQHATPGSLKELQAANAAREADRIALDARTIDQVAPGEQQPESDHFFKGEGSEAGINNGRHWRHASKWFSYELNDPKGEARVLRLAFAKVDAGRRFDVLVNGKVLAEVTLDANAKEDIYTVDYPIPEAMRKAAKGKLSVRFEARPGSVAGGLYGLRLLR
ncbi:beta-L-arabinofuranosidase domain-containing protein [Telluria beijingensis]|uniref:beta-L-arabinofuranosidase domain-containing protein n=1 Tax=Telluria beijingensis TaxID=3068633 RepID=UPI0027961796|nr:beta-L-arabinofuranosidase domain-containing protein [Massilia sp. REN29]